jgi:hypothetical protein
VEIRIEFDKGKWRVSPDPAEVPRGTRVWWRFQSNDLRARRVRWTVYFANGYPFAPGNQLGVLIGDRVALSTDTTKQQDGQHAGTSPEITADAPGDYKYGVRAEDLDEGQQLGDDDPRLIVV